MKGALLIVLANERLKIEVGELLSSRLGKAFVNLEGIFNDNLASNRLLKTKPSEYYELLREETLLSLKELKDCVISVNKNLLTERFIKEARGQNSEFRMVFVEISKKDFIKHFEEHASDLEMQALTYDEMNKFYKKASDIYVKAKKFDRDVIVLDIIKQIK